MKLRAPSQRFLAVLTALFCLGCPAEQQDVDGIGADGCGDDCAPFVVRLESITIEAFDEDNQCEFFGTAGEYQSTLNLQVNDEPPVVVYRLSAEMESRTGFVDELLDPYGDFFEAQEGDEICLFSTDTYEYDSDSANEDLSEDEYCLELTRGEDGPQLPVLTHSYLNCSLRVLPVYFTFEMREEIVQPVEALATSYGGARVGAENLIDGIGLVGDSEPIEERTHGNNLSASGMWQAGAIEGALGGPTGLPPLVNTQELVFDLGERDDPDEVGLIGRGIDGIYVWNFNQVGETGRGIKEVEVLTNVSDLPLVPGFFFSEGIFTLEEACGCPDETAQFIEVSARARWLKLRILSTHDGAPADYVGVSEVAISIFEEVR